MLSPLITSAWMLFGLLVALAQHSFSVTQISPDKSSLTLEQMLIGLKSTPPHTASDFLASIVSHYGVPIFRNVKQDSDLAQDGQNSSESRFFNASTVLRQYDTQDNRVALWIPDTGTKNQPKTSMSVSIQEIAQSAACEPEIQTVHLARLVGSSVSKPDTSQNTDLYFPHCVRLPKCGGCCPSERLRCSPTQVSRVNISIMHVQYTSAERKFQFCGIKQVQVERHLQCACECIQQASDCGPGQKYRADECRCICPAERKIDCMRRQQNPNNLLARFVFWNSVQCRCECRPPGGIWRCSTGYKFNYDSCRCEQIQTKQSSRSLPGIALIQQQYRSNKSIQSESKNTVVRKPITSSSSSNKRNRKLFQKNLSWSRLSPVDRYRLWKIHSENGWSHSS